MELQLSVPATADNVPLLRHAMAGFLEGRSVTGETAADVLLAVTEACTNVVVHAYPDGEGPMGLRASVLDDHVAIVIHDRGRGIVPRADSPGLGLGLPLIATLADSLELGTGEAEETEVRMTFALTAADSVPLDDGQDQ